MLLFLNLKFLLRFFLGGHDLSVDAQFPGIEIRQTHLEEVDLSVSAPDESGVDEGRDSVEAGPDRFWIAVVHLLSGEPVVVGAAEEVRLAVRPRERGVEVSG